MSQPDFIANDSKQTTIVDKENLWCYQYMKMNQNANKPKWKQHDPRITLTDPQFAAIIHQPDINKPNENE